MPVARGWCWRRAGAVPARRLAVYAAHLPMSVVQRSVGRLFRLAPVIAYVVDGDVVYDGFVANIGDARHVADVIHRAVVEEGTILPTSAFIGGTGVAESMFLCLLDRRRGAHATRKSDEWQIKALPNDRKKQGRPQSRARRGAPGPTCCEPGSTRRAPPVHRGSAPRRGTNPLPVIRLGSHALPIDGVPGERSPHAVNSGFVASLD